MFGVCTLQEKLYNNGYIYHFKNRKKPFTSKIFLLSPEMLLL